MKEIRAAIEAHNRRESNKGKDAFQRWEAIRGDWNKLARVTVTSKADENHFWVLDDRRRNKVAADELVKLTPETQAKFEAWLVAKQTEAEWEKRAEGIKKELFP